MNKTLTSVLALAGLAAAAGAAQAADAVVAGDGDQPTLLTSTQMDAVTAGGVIEFAKLVQIQEEVLIFKDIFVASFVIGNSALANATADALGSNSHTETLTETTAVQGVGSSSNSESVSLAND